MSFNSLDLSFLGATPGYVIYSTEEGFIALKEVVDGNTTYLSSGQTDLSTIGNSIMKGSVLTDVSSSGGSFAPLANLDRPLLKVGSSWAVMTEYLDSSNILLDRTFSKSGLLCTILTGSTTTIVTNHSFKVNDPVAFEATAVLPTGMSLNTVYYVKTVNSDKTNFTISATSGGADLVTSGVPAGQFSVYKVFDTKTPSYHPNIQTDTIIGKITSTGEGTEESPYIYTIEPYYTVNNAASNPITTVSGLPQSGDYTGQLVYNSIDGSIYS